MENMLHESAPPVEMNNNTYEMVSLQQSVRIDEMKFRSIGPGGTGGASGFGGLGPGGFGPGFGGGALGPFTGAQPYGGFGGGAFELSNPYYNAADPAGIGLPQSIQPGVGFGSEALSYEGDYEATGDEGGRLEDEDYDYNEVRLILMKIQRHNPGFFKAFMRMGMPYYEVRRIMRKIIRLTLLYQEEEES